MHVAIAIGADAQVPHFSRTIADIAAELRAVNALFFEDIERLAAFPGVSDANGNRRDRVVAPADDIFQLDAAIDRAFPGAGTQRRDESRPRIRILLCRQPRPEVAADQCACVEGGAGKPNESESHFSAISRPRYLSALSVRHKKDFTGFVGWALRTQHFSHELNRWVDDPAYRLTAPAFRGKSTLTVFCLALQETSSGDVRSIAVCTSGTPSFFAAFSRWKVVVE